MSVKHIQDIPTEPVPNASGVSKAVLISSAEAPNFAMRKFSMQPGGSMPLHTNKVEHEQYVLRGRAQVRLGEEIFEVSAGDIVFIPADWCEPEVVARRIGFGVIGSIFKQTGFFQLFEFGIEQTLLETPDFNNAGHGRNPLVDFVAVHRFFIE